MLFYVVLVVGVCCCLCFFKPARSPFHPYGGETHDLGVQDGMAWSPWSFFSFFLPLGDFFKSSFWCSRAPVVKDAVNLTAGVQQLFPRSFRDPGCEIHSPEKNWPLVVAGPFNNAVPSKTLLWKFELCFSIFQVWPTIWYCPKMDGLSHGWFRGTTILGHHQIAIYKFVCHVATSVTCKFPMGLHPFELLALPP